MNDLSNVNVGDEVIWHPPFARAAYFRKVERVTKTQIIIDDGRRFNKTFGREVGVSGYGSSMITRPTEGSIRLAHKTKVAAMRSRLSDEIKKSDLTLDQLRRIEAIMQEGSS